MEHLDRRVLLGAAGLAGVAAMARLANAGPLNPPAGPVSPTGRTTQEIFDRVTSAEADARRGWIPLSTATTPGVAGTSTYRITQPGAYYLAGPVDAGANQYAIDITGTIPVTLDLNGHTVTADGTGRIGIHANGNSTSLVIRNGRVLARNGASIAVFAYSTGGVLEDLEVVTTGTGIDVWHSVGSTIRRCRVMCPTGTGSWGVTSGNNAVDMLIEDVQVSGEGQWAIGITAALDSTIRGCQVSSCSGTGIVARARSILEGCLVSGVGGNGISAGSQSSLYRCVSIGNASNGVSASAGTTIVECVANQCTFDGIAIASDALVDRCRVSANGNGGIRAAASSVVRACFVDSHTTNGAFGIKADGANMQVLDNQISRCTIGVDFRNQTGCVAFRNVVRTCTNPIAVSAGGNWYPNVDFSTLNTATNPFANLFTT